MANAKSEYSFKNHGTLYNRWWDPVTKLLIVKTHRSTEQLKSSTKTAYL